jgi:Type IX secretion system protein PorV
MQKVFYITILFFCSQVLTAQNRVITTAVPFLTINPGAQSMGIADIGVVAASCYYESGLTQNPALLSRYQKVIGFRLSYKTWLRNLVADIVLADGHFYYAFNKKNALAFSQNSFNYGSVTYTDINGNVVGQTYAREDYHNLRYAHSFNEHLSLGVGLKYIKSDIVSGIKINGNSMRPGLALGCDIGLDYRKEIIKQETSFIRYDFGVSILNMGNKIKYYKSDKGSFMPMQLCLGTLWTFSKSISEKTRYCIDLAYQAEKLLVPTPPQYGYDSNGNPVIIKGKDPNVSVAQGAVQSFYDAPDGANEEVREILHKVGIENRFEFNNKSSFALRVGYLKESVIKGDRKNVNVGIGVKIRPFFIDGAMVLLYNQNGELKMTPKGKGFYSLCVTIGCKFIID